MSTSRQVRRIASTPEHLTIEWTDGAVAEFAGVWLRDNLSEDRDPHSGQRLVDIADLPARPLIRSASVAGDAVRIEWESETAIATFAVVASSAARKLAGLRSGIGGVAFRALELCASLLVTAFGMLLLTGYVATERLFGS